MCTLYQYSLAYVFDQKRYDGNGLIEELKPHGDIGLGTFNAMEGELVIADNEFYQCTDSIITAEGCAKTPWAAITRFTGEYKEETLENITSMDDFVQKLLDSTAAKDYPYVLQIQGEFNQITFRQVLKQEKPYPDIATVFGTSPEQYPKDITANVVGFYMPEYMYPLQPAGIHLHGISEDKQSGGHILDFNLKRATLRYEKIKHVKMDLKLD